jgi:hypothetical protein
MVGLASTGTIGRRRSMDDRARGARMDGSGQRWRSRQRGGLGDGQQSALGVGHRAWMEAWCRCEQGKDEAGVLEIGVACACGSGDDSGAAARTVRA